MKITTIFQIIPNASLWKEIILIDKGWSLELKYKVIDKSNQLLLLRIANIEKYDQKFVEFNMLSHPSLKNLNLSIPFEIGKSLDNNYVYTLSNWIDGEDTAEVINQYSEIEQYKLGCEAGNILNAIHKIPINKQIFTWNTFYQKKIERKIDQMNQCSIQLEHHSYYLDCINRHKQLLIHRPLTFQHGDFHIGNTLIANDSISLIDFNRHDIGDPWEEFNRIPFSAEISPAFATGCIDGYFNHVIPDDFFPLLALYTSVNIIASIPWAISYGKEEIDTMKRLSCFTLHAYDFFKTDIPKWYLTLTKYHQKLE